LGNLAGQPADQMQKQKTRVATEIHYFARPVSGLATILGGPKNCVILSEAKNLV
jgi:hypothetical protein